MPGKVRVIPANTNEPNTLSSMLVLVPILWNSWIA